MKFTESSASARASGKDAIASTLASINAPGDQAYVTLLQSLADSIHRSFLSQPITGQPIVVSVSGAQGSGKTTLAIALAHLLQNLYSLPALNLSIDDFYLTRAERKQLAARVHPLLATRGVPGTHDVDDMLMVIEALRGRTRTTVPRFDKAIDDRVPDRLPVDPVDVVICEGWCWGVTPEPDDQLGRPLNDLEASQDADGTWRRFVNEQIQRYQPLFQTDGHLFLAVPDMASVHAWRWQQEQALKASGRGSRIMNRNEVIRFISFYERLTQWMLASMPETADVVARLDAGHCVQAVQYR